MILRTLWRKRLLVVLLAVVAVAGGYVLAFYPRFPPESRSYTVGVASARILLDTPESQVVDVAPEGSDALGPRASVLANLMVDGEIKDAIAKKAGIDPKKLLAATEASGGAEAAIPKGESAARVNLLTTSVLITSDMVELPIIKVQAQAPDAAQAGALANAAVEGLRDYLNTRASNERIADDRRLRVTGLGPAQATESVRGRGKVLAVGLALFLFLAGCALIVGLTALIRTWRDVDAVERDGGVPLRRVEVVPQTVAQDVVVPRANVISMAGRHPAPVVQEPTGAAQAAKPAPDRWDG